MKPVLAVDFDDTVVSHIDTLVDSYNQSHEDHITVHDVHFAQKVGAPKSGWHGNRAEALKWIADYMATDHALQTPPVAAAVEVLTRLKERYRLMIVTGREQSWQPQTEEWINRFMPNLFDEVHYAGDIRKSVICNQIGAKTIIDDSPVYLADCIAAGIRGIAFGDYGWNQDAELPEGAERAKTWNEVEELLS